MQSMLHLYALQFLNIQYFQNKIIAQQKGGSRGRLLNVLSGLVSDRSWRARDGELPGSRRLGVTAVLAVQESVVFGSWRCLVAAR
ncbi:MULTISPECIES: hypothetical protein [Bradyrhizobium]|uniref:hypothetical protein n=1 Tax=Bradyrhizobium TaxID=374 RepID=UPI00138AFCBB|nr:MULTISPECIES: hypothetical protein [Bradyrhizobium]